MKQGQEDDQADGATGGEGEDPVDPASRLEGDAAAEVDAAAAGVMGGGPGLVTRYITVGVPLRDRVMVKRFEAETAPYAGGIETPSISKEAPSEGIITAVGDGRILENGTHIPVALEVGQHVLFGKYGGVDIEIENETFVILREDEVMVRLEQREA